LSPLSFSSCVDCLESLCGALVDDTCTLKALILSKNPIGDNGFDMICNALRRNKTVVLLACAECQLSKQAIPTSLLECLRSNTTLQRLYLYGNSAGVTLSPGGGCEDDDRIVEARHWLDVNNNGRSFVSQANFRSEYLPFVLQKVANQQHQQPSLIYSLLMETPHSICRSSRSTTT
jgi:hypothetical protein